jgi:hypothetical protein
MIQASDEIKEPDEIKVRIFQCPFPRDFVDQVLICQDISEQDVEDWCGWDTNSAGGLISFLVRKHALRRDDRFYKKTAAFIALLKEMQRSGSMEKMDRPAYVKEDVGSSSTSQY